MWVVPSYPGSCNGRRQGLHEVCRMEPVTVPPPCLGVLPWVVGCLPGTPWHPTPAAGDPLLCPCPGVAGKAAGRAEQSPLRELGTQHLQPDQRLSRSQSDMFSPKSPALLQPPEPCGEARTKETSPRVNPFSQREDLKGGKTKLFDMPSKSIISLTFNLPPSVPVQLSTPVTPEPTVEV